ncbi:MAG: hypothetical protein J4428_01380 [Candidatus Aenigmarchaeota archaeon]|nr:hypothetical protein [Candidatus Aenigmarchaeota archaeon]
MNSKKLKVAANMLLVTKSGGKTSNFNGKYFNSESHDLLASNGKIRDEILEIVK